MSVMDNLLMGAYTWYAKEGKRAWMTLSSFLVSSLFFGEKEAVWGDAVRG